MPDHRPWNESKYINSYLHLNLLQVQSITVTYELKFVPIVPSYTFLKEIKTQISLFGRAKVYPYLELTCHHEISEIPGSKYAITLITLYRNFEVYNVLPVIYEFKNAAEKAPEHFKGYFIINKVEFLD